MCRATEEGGRRCNGHTPYGINRRNLQAQKQYHEHRLTVANLTPRQKAKSETKLEEAKTQLDALLEEKQQLGHVKSYVMNLTPNTERVLAQLEADGFKPYIVGGSVRDALMGLPSKDIDIEVYGGQADTVAASLKKIGQVDEVGKSFGVLKIRIGEEDFDVSLPRRDSKIGDGHRGFKVEVDPDLSLEEATARRDYTINALMYSHRLGFIIDQHGGLKDLENRQLRHVSDAFDEDPLRVLRGVQMASRFDMNLHPDTVLKAQSLKDEYAHLATERVQIEFQKLYEKGKATQKALNLLADTGWDENFPGLKEANTPALQETVARTQQLLADGQINNDKKALLLSSVIVSNMEDKAAYKFLSETVVGDNLKNAAYNLSREKLPQPLQTNDNSGTPTENLPSTTKAALRAWAHQMPRNISIADWADLMSARGAETTATRIRKHATDLGVLHSAEKDILNGDDIIAKYPDRRSGRWMKDVLDKARNAQYSDIFRTKEGALEWLDADVPEQG